MVVFNDSLHQGKPQPPTSFLGGEAGFEHVLDLALGNAFSIVFNVDKNRLLTLHANGDLHAANATHGVNPIFDNILHHPFEKWFVHLGRKLRSTGLYFKIHL